MHIKTRIYTNAMEGARGEGAGHTPSCNATRGRRQAGPHAPLHPFRLLNTTINMYSFRSVWQTGQRGRQRHRPVPNALLQRGPRGRKTLPRALPLLAINYTALPHTK